VRYRLLPLVVIAAVGAQLLAASLVPAPEALSWVHFAFRVAWRTAATAACLWAGLGFSRGDHLRRAWVLLGATFLLLLLKDVWRGPSLHGLAGMRATPAGSVDLVRDVLVLVANAIGVVAAWVLARTWYRAGLGMGVAGRKQAVALTLATLAALVTAGSTLATDLGALQAGHADATAFLASDVADILSFVLFAPLLLTALALRGGLLGWAWGHLAVGNFAWLLMDVWQSLGAYGAGAAGARLGEELSRTAAAACFLCAGLAQRWLLADLPRAPEPGQE